MFNYENYIKYKFIHIKLYKEQTNHRGIFLKHIYEQYSEEKSLVTGFMKLKIFIIANGYRLAN